MPLFPRPFRLLFLASVVLVCRGSGGSTLSGATSGGPPLLPTNAAPAWTPQAYHARADGKTLDTDAFQAAIDAAAAAGGGVVRVPAGTYLIGTLDLKSGVTLDLAKNALLLGSARVADYRRGHWPALIKAKDQHDIALVGAGAIDGQGRLVAADTLRIIQAQSYLDFFPGLKPGEKVGSLDPWALQKAGKLRDAVVGFHAEGAITRASESVRPQLIEFWGCRGVRVKGVTLRNAACWVETYRACTDLAIEGITVRSTAYWNNDGIDIVDCQRVRIADCDVDAADDGICLKSESAAGVCADVEVAHCRIRSSANAFKIGTTSAGAFRHIRVHDLSIHDTFRSAVALETVDGGSIDDVTVDGVEARHTGNAFFLRIGQRAAARPPGSLRSIVLRHFNVDVPAGRPDAGYENAGPPILTPANLMPASIDGLPGHPIENVRLEAIRIVSAGGGRADRAQVPLGALEHIPERAAKYPEFSMFGELPAWALFVRHARRISLQNVAFTCQNPDFRAAVVADDVAGLELNRCAVRGESAESPVVFHLVTNARVENLELPRPTDQVERR